MRRSYVRATLAIVLTATAILFVGPALADHSGIKTANGLTIYYTVIPTDALRTFSQDSPEAITHSRIPKGKHVHHLLVAVLDGKNMERITDAKVTARVREVGLGWKKKHLEPATFNNELTYCNYFTFYDHTNYTIDIDAQRSNSSDIVTAEFQHINN